MKPFVRSLFLLTSALLLSGCGHTLTHTTSFTPALTVQSEFIDGIAYYDITECDGDNYVIWGNELTKTLKNISLFKDVQPWTPATRLNPDDVLIRIRHTNTLNPDYNDATGGRVWGQVFLGVSAMGLALFKVLIPIDEKNRGLFAGAAVGCALLTIVLPPLPYLSLPTRLPFDGWYDLTVYAADGRKVAWLEQRETMTVKRQMYHSANLEMDAIQYQNVSGLHAIRTLVIGLGSDDSTVARIKSQGAAIRSAMPDLRTLPDLFRDRIMADKTPIIHNRYLEEHYRRSHRLQEADEARSQAQELVRLTDSIVAAPLLAAVQPPVSADTTAPPLPMTPVFKDSTKTDF